MQVIVMPRDRFSSMNCAIAQTLAQVGERWSLLILRNAFNGMTRFDDFQKDLGVATNILAARLGRLVKAGILRRERATKDGRAVDYRLTRKGLDLYPVLIALTDWGERWAANPKGSRILLRDRKTGRAVERVSVRSRDGRPLGPSDVVARPGPGSDARIRRLLQPG